MPFYLQMDGVDDKLTIPSFTFTEVIIDFSLEKRVAFARYWTLPFSADYFQIASVLANDQWSAGVSAVYLNSVAQTNVTPVVPVDQRSIVRIVLSSTKTTASYVFNNNTSNFMAGNLYNIKYYNGTALVAHYDTTYGNVQDQSGNGRHATLTGGTWIDDGESGPVEHTVSGSSKNVSTGSASAIRGLQASGASIAGTTSSGAAVRALTGSGSSATASGAMAAVVKGHHATGSAVNGTVAQASASSAGAYTASGSGLSASTASATAIRAVRATGDAQNASSAIGNPIRAVQAAGAAQNETSATSSVHMAMFVVAYGNNLSAALGIAIMGLVASGSSISLSTAHGDASLIDPSRPTYKRRVTFRAELARKQVFRTGIVRHKRYDVKW